MKINSGERREYSRVAWHLFYHGRGIYRERLEQRGIDVLVPDAELRAEINRIIFDELCCGKIVDSSRDIYLRAVDLFRERSAQSVILGCTEIGMLVGEEESSLPLIDTTVVHVDAAVSFVLAGGSS